MTLVASSSSAKDKDETGSEEEESEEDGSEEETSSNKSACSYKSSSPPEQTAAAPVTVLGPGSSAHRGGDVADEEAAHARAREEAEPPTPALVSVGQLGARRQRLCLWET